MSTRSTPRRSGPDPPYAFGAPVLVECTRREILKAGGIALGGLLFATPWIASKRSRQDVVPRSWPRSVIVIYLHGGSSHIDLWDPKPHLPESTQSQFRAISSKLDGGQFTESVPRPAVQSRSFTAIRSTSCQIPKLLFHDAIVYQMLTHRMAASAKPAERVPSANPDLPTVGAGVDVGKVFERTDGRVVEVDSARCRLLVENEPRALKKFYGENGFCRELLLARKLVERGSRVVEVHWPWRLGASPYSWEIHEDLAVNIKTLSAPMIGQALSALFHDLDQTGLLDETLVVAVGKFARSPHTVVTKSDSASSVSSRSPRRYRAITGRAGIKRGLVCGQTDATGFNSANVEVPPADLAAAIYYLSCVEPLVQANGDGGRSSRW